MINRLGVGGAERQLRELVRRSEPGHAIVELEGRSLRALAAELGRLAPDVVAAWLERSQLAVAALPLRVPTVACVRGLPRPRPLAKRWAMRAALSRFTCHVGNSDAVRRETRAFARPFELPRFHVIPNGTDAAAERSVAREPGRPLRVGYVGRANALKGFDVLLEALDRVDPGKVELTMVGRDVPEAVRARFGEAHAHLALAEAADPWQALDGIEAIVVPSRSEGSPNVVIEAFARRVPVVGTDAGGTAELLAEGRGLLVPPVDPASLADALHRLADEWGATSKRVEAAREYVGRVHAWPRVVAAYDALFASLAGR